MWYGVWISTWYGWTIMDFGLEVFQFNRIYDCEHELQNLMVSVSLVLIGTVVAPSFTESSTEIFCKSYY